MSQRNLGALKAGIISAKNYEQRSAMSNNPKYLPTPFLRELRWANVRRAPDFHAGNLNDWSPAERGNELAGEVGELCNVLKKLLRLSKSPLPHDSAKLLQLIAHAREELADVFISADLIGAQLGIDVEEAVRSKFNATSAKIGSKVKL